MKKRLMMICLLHRVAAGICHLNNTFTIACESEYAAWTAAFGYKSQSFYGFTESSLMTFLKEDLNSFLLENGFC